MKKKEIGDIMSRFRLVLLSMLAVLALGAVASATASAFNLRYEICKEEGGEEYESNQCATKAVGGKFSWEPIQEFNAFNIVSEGTNQRLKGSIAETGIEIKCGKVKDIGNIKWEGKDEGGIKYSECTVPTIAGCEVKSPGEKAGLITTAVKSQLVEIEAGVEGTRFEPLTGATFVELEVGKEESATRKFKKACGVLPTSPQKVTGVVVGLAETGAKGNRCEKVSFTEPAQTGSTLNFAGEPATYVGEVTFAREAEDSRAFRCS